MRVKWQYDGFDEPSWSLFVDGEYRGWLLKRWSGKGWIANLASGIVCGHAQTRWGAASALLRAVRGGA